MNDCVDQDMQLLDLLLQSCHQWPCAAADMAASHDELVKHAQMDEVTCIHASHSCLLSLFSHRADSMSCISVSLLFKQPIQALQLPLWRMHSICSMILFILDAITNQEVGSCR